MSWFTKHFGITLDKHSLGNLVKDVAPAAAFTPLGVLGAGGIATLGDELRGKNLKQSLLSGVENAALGGGLASLGTKVGLGTGAHLGFGLGGGGGSAAAGSAGGASSGSAAGSVAAPAAPTAASFETGSSGLGGLPEYATDGGTSGVTSGAASAGLAPAANLATSAPGVGSRGLLSTLGKGAGFLEHHPNTAALGLQGLGDIAGAGTDQRLKNAQASLLESQGGLTANELAQRKASQTALSPYWSALANMPNGRAPVASNPYTTAGG